VSRDPARLPCPGDRWRDEWGSCFVGEVHPDGRVSLVHGETLSPADFARLTRNARFVCNERTGEAA